MADFIIARAAHILAVLMWIGGVGFVTLVLFPSIRRSTRKEERLAAFHKFEGRFAPQAAVWVLLAGASGLWMTWRAGEIAIGGAAICCRNRRRRAHAALLMVETTDSSPTG